MEGSGYCCIETFWWVVWMVNAYNIISVVILIILSFKFVQFHCLGFFSFPSGSRYSLGTWDLSLWLRLEGQNKNRKDWNGMFSPRSVILLSRFNRFPDMPVRLPATFFSNIDMFVPHMGVHIPSWFLILPVNFYCNFFLI